MNKVSCVMEHVWCIINHMGFLFPNIGSFLGCKVNVEEEAEEEDNDDSKDWAMFAYKLVLKKSENRFFTIKAPRGLKLSTMLIGPGFYDDIMITS